jgi:ABC-type phosphate/phosphonate transport system substrate-binding protein/DNA-binding CsgD family transcriptional regulator
MPLSEKYLMKAVLFLLLCLASVSCALAERVAIGVLAYDGKPQALQRWQPTADYLSQQIPTYTFNIIPLTHEELEYAINKNGLHFILTNPAHYAGLEVHFGITRIATFLSRYDDQALRQFSSVIFVRANSPITQLSDLKGQRLAAVSPDAFGGFQLMQDALQQHNIDALQDMDIIWLGFPHSDVVTAIIYGKADVGTVRSGTLEKMAAQGMIDLAEIRVLAKKQTPGFPLLHSVGLYPEWPIATLPETDNALAKQVAMTLLNMPADHEAAITSGGAGWTIPLNYAAIHEVLSRLEIDPYQPGPFSPAQFWQSYRHWISIIVLLMLFVFYSLARYFIVNRHLLAAQKALQEHQEQLEETVQKRTNEIIEVNQALQDEITYHIRAEKTLDTGCDILQTIYSIFIRDDLNRQQRLISVIDSVRRYLSAEFSLLSCFEEGHYSTCCRSPGNAELTAPLSEPLSHQALDTQQVVIYGETENWSRYIACPIFISGELHCLLEFASSLDYQPADEDDISSTSELSLKILSLIAQWVGYEIVLLNNEQKAQERHQDIRQRFATISNREKDVLRLLIQGEPTKSIARTLNLSTKTIEMHRSSLIRKTGAKSSTEIVQLAVLAEIFPDTQ